MATSACEAETASEWQEAFKACDAELRERLPQTEAGTTVLGPDQSVGGRRFVMISRAEC